MGWDDEGHCRHFPLLLGSPAAVDPCWKAQFCGSDAALAPQASAFQQLRSSHLKSLKELETKRAHLVKEAAAAAKARQSAQKEAEAAA